MAAASLIGLGAAAAAVLVLRRAWKSPSRGARQGAALLLGWGLAAAALALLAFGEGFDRGAAIGACVVGVIAYAAIGAGVDVRKARKGREPSAAAEPLDPRPRPMRLARAAVRCLAAVVLAAASALALAAAWALHGPGTPIDRVAVAAYSLPALWGAAMTWALSDDRLVRPVAGLLLLAAAGAGLAFLPEAAA